MKRKILDIDLNDVVSKEVQLKMESLEKEIDNLSRINIEQKKTIGKQDEKLSEINDFILLFGDIRQKYNAIGKTDPDKNGWGGKSITQNRFTFLSDLMMFMFGVETKYGFFDDWSLNGLLALNFYEEKPSIISLCKALKIFTYSLDNKAFISSIESFRMPYNYSKDEILKFVRKPHYCTNGQMFGISRYWNGGENNCPHDLLAKSKYITEDDVFSEIINTLSKKNSSDANLLYAIPKYNDSLTDSQIAEMGETLIDLPNKNYNDCVVSFVRHNMQKFNKKTLDNLYSFASHDNQFKLFYWSNFPYEYQCKFLMSKTFSELIIILNNSSCKWSDEEKEVFVRKYFTDKQTI